MEDLSDEEKQAYLKIKKRSGQLSAAYQNAVQELAIGGEVAGFEIRFVVGNSGEYYTSPISGKDEQITRANNIEKKRFYRQKYITTEEYTNFSVYAGKANAETDVATMEDMTNRLYEYGAKKFLDMDHDLYISAMFDEVKMAVDACLHIMRWNGHIGVTSDRQELAEHVVRRKKPNVSSD